MAEGISIIIPCYNAEHFITRCLDSIINQNDKNYQIILVDDCSTDKTREVIKNYIVQFNHSFSSEILLVANKENLGAGKSRNVGIQYANRPYITFVDADDMLAFNFFDSIYELLLKHSYDCIIFNAKVQEENHYKKLGMFYGKNFFQGEVNTKTALVFVRGCTWGKVYKTSIIKENKVQFSSIKRNEDLVFTKVAISYCKEIFFFDRELYYYIENKESLMHNDNLLDKKNALIAFNQIQHRLENRGFETELHSIYAIEVVYSTMMTTMKQAKSLYECIRYYKNIIKGYRYKDKYYHRYLLKYRLILFLFRFHLFFIVRKLVRK